LQALPANKAAPAIPERLSNSRRDKSPPIVFLPHSDSRLQEATARGVMWLPRYQLSEWAWLKLVSSADPPAPR